MKYYYTCYICSYVTYCYLSAKLVCFCLLLVLITSASGEGSDERLRVRMTSPGLSLLALTKNASWRRFKTTFRHQVSLDTPEWSIIRGFFGYAIRPNLMFVCPFLVIKILKPCPALFLLVIYYYCIRLKNQTSFAIQTEFEESATLPSPQNFHNISIPENEMQQVPSSILKINDYQAC